jgi:hypothetical protein
MLSFNLLSHELAVCLQQHRWLCPFVPIRDGRDLNSVMLFTWSDWLAGRILSGFCNVEKRWGGFVVMNVKLSLHGSVTLNRNWHCKPLAFKGMSLCVSLWLTPGQTVDTILGGRHYTEARSLSGRLMGKIDIINLPGKELICKISFELKWYWPRSVNKTGGMWWKNFIKSEYISINIKLPGKEENCHISYEWSWW